MNFQKQLNDIKNNHNISTKLKISLISSLKQTIINYANQSKLKEEKSSSLSFSCLT